MKQKIIIGRAHFMDREDHLQVGPRCIMPGIEIYKPPRYTVVKRIGWGILIVAVFVLANFVI